MATQKKQPDQVEVVWSDNPDLRTIHANHLWLSRQEGDIFLTFGELPPILKPDAAKPPEKVYIRPVARIAVSPSALARMVKLLEANASPAGAQQVGA